MLSAQAVTTIHYLIQREVGSVKAKRSIRGMLRVFGVTGVNREVIELALEASSPDSEEIVTRDPKGFRGSALPVFTPESVLALIQAQKE